MQVGRMQVGRMQAGRMQVGRSGCCPGQYGVAGAIPGRQCREDAGEWGGL